MITAKPIDYIDVNHFTVTDRLYLVQGNGGNYYIQLFDDDARYVPPSGTTLQLKFPRALSIAPTPTNQDVTVPLAAVSINDGSLYTFTLSSSQVDIITSGGVKLICTQGSTTKTYPVDKFVSKRSNAPGA